MVRVYQMIRRDPINVQAEYVYKQLLLMFEYTSRHCNIEIELASAQHTSHSAMCKQSH